MWERVTQMGFEVRNDSICEEIKQPCPANCWKLGEILQRDTVSYFALMSSLYASINDQYRVK